jgi:hypothetical protein
VFLFIPVVWSWLCSWCRSFGRLGSCACVCRELRAAQEADTPCPQHMSSSSEEPGEALAFLIWRQAAAQGRPAGRSSCGQGWCTARARPHGVTGLAASGAEGLVSSKRSVLHALQGGTQAAVARGVRACRCRAPSGGNGKIQQLCGFVFV